MSGKLWAYLESKNNRRVTDWLSSALNGHANGWLHGFYYWTVSPSLSITFPYSWIQFTVSSVSVSQAMHRYSGGDAQWWQVGGAASVVFCGSTRARSRIDCSLAQILERLDCFGIYKARSGKTEHLTASRKLLQQRAEVSWVLKPAFGKQKTP